MGGKRMEDVRRLDHVTDIKQPTATPNLMMFRNCRLKFPSAPPSSPTSRARERERERKTYPLLPLPQTHCSPRIPTASPTPQTVPSSPRSQVKCGSRTALYVWVGRRRGRRPMHMQHREEKSQCERMSELGRTRGEREVGRTDEANLTPPSDLESVRAATERESMVLS
jgi:hypothetical protein